MNERTDRFALGAGLVLVTIGVSGALNSTGLLSHPTWLPLVLVVAALAAAMAVRAAKDLIPQPHPPSNPAEDPA